MLIYIGYWTLNIYYYYHVRSDEIEKETMRYMRVVWNSRQRHERMRDFE